MNDERVNHYYPAGVMAFGFAKNINDLIDLRDNNVDVINIPRIIELFKKYKNDTCLKEYLITQNLDNNKKFLYEKKASEIFTAKNLKEESDKKIQNIERSILKLLQKGWLKETYKIETEEQEKEDSEILRDFIELSLNRSILFTDNFKEKNIVAEIEGLKKIEWLILESEDDCAVISDLNPILVLSLNDDVINFFNFETSIKDSNVYFVPIVSNKWLIVSNNKDVINSFFEKCQNTDFKTDILNFLFAQALMFSLQYIVVGKNNWMIDLVINLISNDEFREEFINKRKNEYKLIKFFNTIHNLKK